jgi:hypothetical protein
MVMLLAAAFRISDFLPGIHFLLHNNQLSSSSLSGVIGRTRSDFTYLFCIFQSLLSILLAAFKWKRYQHTPRVSLPDWGRGGSVCLSVCPASMYVVAGTRSEVFSAHKTPPRDKVRIPLRWPNFIVLLNVILSLHADYSIF